tara:strand:+ start:728 stop:1147 length:420 start_codon:yes stop_codon:yes gene_type:complete
MRPIPSPASSEAFELLKKANSLLERADALEKADKCPECGNKLEKGNCMMKAGCTMSKYGAVQKGEHHKAQSFDFNPGHVQFMSETGGQTFNAYYTTNQSLLDSEDVANKGATSQSVNLEPLNAKQNPHDNPAPGHQIEG